jgi:predicted ester cyclase
MQPERLGRSSRAAQNKTIVHTFADRINAKNLEGALTLFGPNHVEHAAYPGMQTGVEAIRAYFSMLFAGFPDAQTTILDTIAEGDKVVVRAVTEGTHTGRFLGIPPTGRRAKWSFVGIHRIAAGKIVEHWVETDQMNLMQQLGLVPPPSGH